MKEDLTGRKKSFYEGGRHLVKGGEGGKAFVKGHEGG